MHGDSVVLMRLTKTKGKSFVCPRCELMELMELIDLMDPPALRARNPVYLKQRL